MTEKDEGTKNLGAPDGALPLCAVCGREDCERMTRWSSDITHAQADAECYRIGFLRMTERADRDAKVMDAWRGHFLETCDALFPESVGRPHLLGWKHVIERARGLAAGNATPRVAPSSPSDLSARETEDQQELIKAAAPRSSHLSAEEILQWIDASPGDCPAVVRMNWSHAIAMIDRSLLAAESRGRERGIEEAIAAVENEADYGDRVNALTGAIRALTSGASADASPPKESVKSGAPE